MTAASGDRVILSFNKQFIQFFILRTGGNLKYSIGLLRHGNANNTQKSEHVANAAAFI